MEDGSPELQRRASRFLEKMNRIIDWAVFPVSNSVCEGVNKNIQDARRQACGFRSLQNFIETILLRQGELTFRF